MSSISFSAVVAIINLVFNLVVKIVRSIDVIRDLSDDGIVNDSIRKPVFDALDKISSSLDVIQSELRDLEKIGNPDND